MPKKIAIDDTTKRAALGLLEQGLITQTEAAGLLGISKELMHHWCKGIDWDTARRAYVQRLWSRVTYSNQ